jgi:hypothetical protein
MNTGVAHYSFRNYGEYKLVPDETADPILDT